MVIRRRLKPRRILLQDLLQLIPFGRISRRTRLDIQVHRQDQKDGGGNVLLEEFMGARGFVGALRVSYLVLGHRQHTHTHHMSPSTVLQAPCVTGRLSRRGMRGMGGRGAVDLGALRGLSVFAVSHSLPHNPNICG
eukprot:4176188-Alexandrium_andersonii.AAC.1